MSAARDLLVYGAFVRGTFKKMLAYRLRYVTGIFSYLVYVTTYYFLWKAVFEHRTPDPRAADAVVGGDATIAGYDLPQMTTYVAIGWIARSFYFNNIDRELGEQVQNGQVVTLLARPISFQGMVVANALGEGLFRFFFFSVPIGVVIFLCFPVARPTSWGAVLAFVASNLLALLVLTHLNFLVGLCAFTLKSIDGVMRAKHYLLELLSGLLLPVALFPEWLQVVSNVLPFQAVASVPLSIWLGRLDGAALWRGLGIQAAWAAGLALVSAWAWSRITRRITVQGG